MIRRRIPMDALQAGVYGILTEHDLDIPVYDSLPADASPPYIVIGAFTWRRDGNKTVDKGRATSQIHIWSAYAGKAEINQIMNDVTALLTSWRLDLSDADFVVLDQDVEMCEAFETEENGQHGVVTFVAEIQNIGG
jgi:hypothetical protein